MDETQVQWIKELQVGLGVFFACLGLLDNVVLLAILLGGCMAYVWNTPQGKCLSEALAEGQITRSQIIKCAIAQPAIQLGLALFVLLQLF